MIFCFVLFFGNNEIYITKSNDKINKINYNKEKEEIIDDDK